MLSPIFGRRRLMFLIISPIAQQFSLAPIASFNAGAALGKVDSFKLGFRVGVAIGARVAAIAIGIWGVLSLLKLGAQWLSSSGVSGVLDMLRPRMVTQSAAA